MHTRTDLLDCTRSWVPPAIAAAPAIERPTVKTPAARNRCNMISSWYRPPPHSPSAGFAPCITSTSSDLTPCRRRVLSPGDLGVTSQRTSRRCFLKLVDGFDQLQQAERLDQILVGTRFKTSRTVFTLPPSGQQNDLGADQLGISLDAPAHLQSINAPRHHHIKKHQIRAQLLGHTEACLPIRRFKYFVRHKLHGHSQKLANIRMVVDDQYFFHAVPRDNSKIACQADF